MMMMMIMMVQRIVVIYFSIQQHSIVWYSTSSVDPTFNDQFATLFFFRGHIILYVSLHNLEAQHSVTSTFTHSFSIDSTFLSAPPYPPPANSTISGVIFLFVCPTLNKFARLYRTNKHGWQSSQQERTINVNLEEDILKNKKKRKWQSYSRWEWGGKR